MKYDYNQILKRILDVGEQMLVYGAEVSRVEDSIGRMCKAYEFKHADVFIITTSMVVTVETRDGQILTQTRRINNVATDFDKLDYLNDLSRRVCKEKPDDRTLEKYFDEVLSRKSQKPLVKYIGAALITGGFAMFFGGTPLDGICAAIVGMMLLLFDRKLKKQGTHEVVYFIIVSFVAGVVSVLLTIFDVGQNEDKIMIGAIMILIPGIAMTNSIRDMLLGDTISGLLRLSQSLIIAAAIAVGFGLAIYALGGAII